MLHPPTRRHFNLGLLGLAAASGSLAGCALPDRSPRVTAVDCHAHVFRRDLPMPDRRRAPAGYDATVDDYLRQLDANGLSHGVLIQPSFLGTDNSYFLKALRAWPKRLRGVVMLDPGTDERTLAELDALGVRGLRLNLVGLPFRRIPGSYPGSLSVWQDHALPRTTAFVVELPGGNLSARSAQRHAEAVLSVAGSGHH